MRVSQHMRGVLEMVAMMPLITAGELSSVSTIETWQLRRELSRASKDGLVRSVPHRKVGPPLHRWVLTRNGVKLLASLNDMTDAEALRMWPVAAEWERALRRRMTTVALCYRIVLEALQLQPGDFKWRWERSDVYDGYLTLSTGQTFGILRFGPTSDSKSISSRIQSLNVLSDYGYSRAAVVVVPGPVEQNGLAERMTSSRMNLIVGVEDDVMNSPAGEAVWRVPGFRRLELLPMAGFIRGTHKRIMPPIRRPPKRASMPRDDDADRDKDNILSLGEPALRLMETVSDWPLIKESTARALCGMKPNWFMAQRSALEKCGVLERVRLRTKAKAGSDGEGRLALSNRGLRLVAWRDRTRLSELVRTWGIAAAAPTEGRAGTSHTLQGTKLRVAAREMSHTDSLHETVTALYEASQRNDGWEVEQILPTHRWERWFRYNNRRYGIRPDATALIRINGMRMALLLEYEQRALNPKRMSEKVTRYIRYFGSLDTGLDFTSPPVAVMVFPDNASSSRLAVNLNRMRRRARGNRPRRFRMIAGGLESIAEAGFDGPCWLDPEHLDAGYVTLGEAVARMSV